MRAITTLIIASFAIAAPVLPATAKSNKQNATRYEYDGRYYNNLAQCQEAKRMLGSIPG
jgi:hypothetical protein